MSTVSVDTVTLDLRSECSFDFCESHARELYDLLNQERYSRSVSLMPVYGSREEWEDGHRTARKAAWKAEKIGYRFAEVDNSLYTDDIYEINTSKKIRQGRPMSPGYTVRKPRGSLSRAQTQCRSHRTYTYGVLNDVRLVAYLTLHRAGDLAMVSMILGHGDEEPFGIMYLLIAGMVESQAGCGGWFFYNRHDSGTEGLRFKKERYGFRPYDVEWKL